MKAVKDSMVIINLAKTTVLETSCDYFGKVMIPPEVFAETVIAGKIKNMEDAFLIEKVIKSGKIEVKKVKENKLIKMAHEFNIYGGEAASWALYQQEGADFLISDDYNLRKKAEMINARIIGSLAVLLKLKQNKRISVEKFKNAIEKMREIGWFSNSILDKILMEGEKYA